MVMNPSHVKDTGYMGDSARGASLGRVSTSYPLTGKERLWAAKVQVDAQGYDKGGAYWGRNDLFVVYTQSHDFVVYIGGCKTRKEAADKVRIKYGLSHVIL